MSQRSAYAMLRDSPTDGSISASVAQCLKPKQLGVQSADISYPQTLQEIADTHKFSATFVDVMEPTAAGRSTRLSSYCLLICFMHLFLDAVQPPDQRIDICVILNFQ